MTDGIDCKRSEKLKKPIFSVTTTTTTPLQPGGSLRWSEGLAGKLRLGARQIRTANSVNRSMWAASRNAFLEFLNFVNVREKNYQTCTFASDGPGVPLNPERIAEMETSDDLRSELCCCFLSESAWVKSYGSSKFLSKGLCSLKRTMVPVVKSSNTVVRNNGSLSETRRLVTSCPLGEL